MRLCEKPQTSIINLIKKTVFFFIDFSFQSILRTRKTYILAKKRNAQFKNISFKTKEKKLLAELKESELFAILPPIKERNPKSVIIIPGGGYSKLTYDEGAFQIAKWMNTHEMSAFVLNLPRITQILTNNCAKIKSAKSV